MSKNIQLSVVINTKNSAKYLADCLTSVKDLADEIVIVDMASTDDTVTLAEKFGASVHQYPEPEVGFVEPAREDLFERASGHWLLLLDSDETISEPLAQKISAVINDGSSADVYFIARQNIIFDHAFTATGWYPDYQARLWKKDSLTWPPEIHSVPEIHGTNDHLPATSELSIIHQNYQTISDFLTRANRYSDVQAKRDDNSTHAHSYTPEQFIECFFQEWHARFFANNGYQDGNHGAMLSILQANYQLTVLAKQWQAAGFPHHHCNPKALAKTLKTINRHTQYWLADLGVHNSTGLAKLYYRLKRKLAS
jgi:(heptosyl)LPS beta-1,4-glucosyltransferase